ncbi:MAG: hypothetical protein OXU64_07850 [Gemmatimonadota bacterium]|nr:hypothetical protein [Gemmatimonadota bacterium]
MFSNRSQASLPFTSLACGLLALAWGSVAACGGDDKMTEPDGDLCSVGEVLGPGEECSVGADTFEVMADGLACLIEPDGGSWECSTRELARGGFSASNIDDTLDWRIDSMP